MCTGDTEVPEPPPVPPQAPHMPRTGGQPSKSGNSGGGGVFAGTLLTEEYNVPGQSLLGSSSGSAGNVQTGNG